MTFGEKLKSLRENKGLTQKDLGEMLGISARLVSYYETNKTIPNDPTILNTIASIFQVSLDYLLGEDNQESKLHQLARKLTNATKQNRLKWDWFRLEPYSWTSDFVLNGPTNKSYEDGDDIVNDESFYVNYKNGAYVLMRIFNSGTKNYKTALFIHYNDGFVFYASDTDIIIIEDLYLAVRNQVLGVDSFVDEFLEDDFEPGNNLSNFDINDPFG